MPSVYFAGPDVFRKDYDQHVTDIRALCAQAGLTPLLPGDGECDNSLAIFDANIKLIQKADGIIANLNPFRSLVEPDSGTVFECGYGFALGKFVIGIINDERDLVTKLVGPRSPEGDSGPVLSDGFMVEDFGHPLNLMLAHCLCAAAPTLKDAVAAVAARHSR